MNPTQWQNLNKQESIISNFLIFKGLHIQDQDYLKVKKIAEKVDWKAGTGKRRKQIKELIKTI